MKSLILLISLIPFIILGACSDDTTDVETQEDETVSAEQSEEETQEDESIPEEQNEEGSQEEDAEDPPEEEVTVDESSSEENVSEVELPENVISYNEMEKSSVQYIKDITPNDLALEIEKTPHDFPVVNKEDMENYEQRVDLDGDGSEEQIKVLVDATSSDEYPSYILAIFDSHGNPKYAEYQYNAESLDDPMAILEVTELTGDNFMEIVVDSASSFGFMEGNGNQSLARLVYGFDADSGNFRQLPTLGSYYDIYWEEDLVLQIDERLSGLSTLHDYKETLGSEFIETFGEYGSLDEYYLQAGERVIGAPRRVFSQGSVERDQADNQVSLSSFETIHENPDIPEMSLMNTSLYEWNEAYGWFEVVNSDFSPSEENEFSFEKEVYDISEFDDKFSAGNAQYEDYLGNWQMVIDGKLQERYLNIEEDTILEIERNLKNYEQTIQREVLIDNYIYKEETGQLIPTGEMIPYLNEPYNKSYQNLFTLLETDDGTMLMDRYGHLYVKEGNADVESEDDLSAAAESDEASANEEEHTGDTQVNGTIDILFPEFIDEFFAGPEAYNFEAIEEGMSQAEVENLLGQPDDYYAVGGAEFAIHGNIAILYSEYFPVQEGVFEEIAREENFVTSTEVYLGVTHDEMVAAYGEPTLRYDEYQNYGPGADETIYDHTRNNGYAIYIEVDASGTATLMTKGEERELPE